MTRPYNFSAGPAAIPDAVLIQAASEMLDWHGSGMGVMEMSHRGKEFMSIYEEAEADLRELLAIPANFKANPIWRPVLKPPTFPTFHHPRSGS